MTDRDRTARAAPTEDCCAAVDPRIARHFDKRMRAAAAAGEFPQMVEVSRGLLGLLSDVESVRPTLLELGCGSGGLTVALLERGAVRADGVDLSPESVATAKRRAEMAGVDSRVNFQLGDGSQAAVSPHDWVVLDRVICCYSDVDRLLANSIGAAEKRYAFSVPLDNGWQGLVNRTILTAEKLTRRLRGNPCPGYTHSIAKIRRRLRDAGFEALRERKVGLWYAAVFERRR
ncbi:MAG: class I SAM-dependent methyltransferase [Candidatus Limnocylindrales bacterium]